MRLLLALLLLFTSLAPASADTAFKRALAAYKTGEFQTALDEFKKIAQDENQISAALCHNIGNAEYKIGQAADGDKPDQRKAAEARYGQASIWYRRALALDPWLPETQQNLRFLQGKLGFHFFAPESFLEKAAAKFPRWQWRTAVFASLWTAGIAIVWLAWATPRAGRRWPLVTLLSIAAVFGTCAGLGLWKKMSDRAPFAKRLVNIAAGPPEPSARTAPLEVANSVMPLKPGSELLPIREEGYWTYVEIPGSDSDHPTRGWVRTTTLQHLWPTPENHYEGEPAWNSSLVE